VEFSGVTAGDYMKESRNSQCPC